MNSHITPRFRKNLSSLPKSIQRQARQAYQQFLSDPYYPGLDFKQVHASQPIYSVRIGISYRAVGVLRNDTIIWFWIGSHADYDKIIAQIR